MIDPYEELRAYRDMMLADKGNLWHAETIANDLNLILADLDKAPSTARQMANNAGIWDHGARWGFNLAKSNHDWQTNNPYRKEFSL